MNDTTFTDHLNSTSETPAKSGLLGLMGLILGALGLALHIATPHLIVIQDPPAKLSDRIAKAGEKLTGRVIDRIKGKAPAPDAPVPFPLESCLSMAAALMGVLGMIFGVLSWSRREDPRLGGCVIVIGGIALAWEYLLFAIALVFILIFLMPLLQFFDS